MSACESRNSEPVQAGSPETLNASRIVSLAPNITELLFHIGAGERVVGTDDFSDSPASAAKLPKVGGVQPNAEVIRTLSPDLVVSSSSVNHPGLERLLNSLDIAMYVVKTDRVEDIPNAMSSLAAVLGSTHGEARADDFRNQLAAQRRERKTRPRVLFMVWPDPLYVAARQTFVDDLLIVTGAENALPAHVRGWPQISLEPLIAASPDLILYPDRSVGREQLEKLFASDIRWRSIQAVREKRYYPVSEDLFTRPGPRLPQAAAMLNVILDQWEASG